MTCAPFLALRAVQQLIEDEGSKYPLAIATLTEGRYVKDIFDGADSIQKAQETVKQVNQLCMAGGFPLKKWTKEYLQHYQRIYKWNQTLPELQQGALVLIIDEKYPPTKWPLGRVLKVHPGKDGHVRVATVKISTSTFDRPITKLRPLPVIDE